MKTQNTDSQTVNQTEKGFKNFNRHEVFTPEMHTIVWDIRKAVETAEWEKDETVFGPVGNRIMGLFDGYLYDNLIQDVVMLGCNKEVINELTEMVQIIEEEIRLKAFENWQPHPVGCNCYNCL